MKKDPIVKKKKGYWIDANENKWDCDKFTKDYAIKLSRAMTSCGECINCIDCIDCYRCISCTSCVRCVVCCGHTCLQDLHSQPTVVIHGNLFGSHVSVFFTEYYQTWCTISNIALNTTIGVSWEVLKKNMTNLTQHCGNFTQMRNDVESFINQVESHFKK